MLWSPDLSQNPRGPARPALPKLLATVRLRCSLVRGAVKRSSALPPAETPVADEEPRFATGPKRKILAGDDVRANLVSRDAVLAGMHCEIIRASSGSQAFGLLARHEFAVMLLDVQMPILDGYELARRARESLARRDLPVLFLTAEDRDEQRTWPTRPTPRSPAGARCMSRRRRGVAWRGRSASHAPRPLRARVSRPLRLRHSEGPSVYLSSLSSPEQRCHTVCSNIDASRSSRVDRRGSVALEEPTTRHADVTSFTVFDRAGCRPGSGGSSCWGGSLRKPETLGSQKL